MADITPLIKSNQMVIQAYGPNGFKISGKTYAGPVIVFPSNVIEWDGKNFTGLVALRNELDVVLLGTGATMQMLPKEQRMELSQKGLHVETMDTGAACRTYNALMADGRRVAAALIMPKS